MRLIGTWHYGSKMSKKDLKELKGYKKDLTELKSYIADFMTAVSDDLQVTKDAVKSIKEAVKSVFDKFSEMEDFKEKTVIHQVATKKRMGVLQDEVEAMKAKLSETCVFLDTISTKLEKLSATQAKKNIWRLW